MSTFDGSAHLRTAAGVTTGGQFATKAKGEPAVALGSDPQRESVVEVPPDGTRVWRADGRLHRTDGPAIEYTDGTREWWVDGHGSTRADTEYRGRTESVLRRTREVVGSGEPRVTMRGQITATLDEAGL